MLIRDEAASARIVHTLSAATCCEPVWRRWPRVPNPTVCTPTARLGIASATLLDGRSRRLATKGYELSGLDAVDRYLHPNPVRIGGPGLGGSLVRTYEHTGPVWALTWSRDRRVFLSLDGTMQLWDVETGRCLRNFDGHQARCVAWSADEKQALSASNSTLRLTDLQSGQCLRELKGHGDGIYCAAFDVNAQRALSGSRDQTARLWDLRTGRCTTVLVGHTYHVHGVAWGANQRHAISWSRDIRLWDVKTGECVRIFNGHADTIRTVHWSADQRRLLSASHDRTVRLWDAETGQ